MHNSSTGENDSEVNRAMDKVKKSIHIWRSNRQTGGPNDLNHAMSLLLKASILKDTMKRYRWAVKVYRKAALIISDIKGTRMNTETLLNNISLECEQVIELA